MTGFNPNDERLSVILALKSSLSPIVISRLQSDHTDIVNNRGGRMQPDIFGNLSQASEVLAKLEEITSKDCLDEHQVGLARILRYRQNQSLLHAALECATKIERASDILIAEVHNVLVAHNLPIPIRSLAACALGHLICRRPAKEASDFDLDMVAESMAHVLYQSKSPALKKALFEAIGLARNRKSRNGGRQSLLIPGRDIRP
jgi:hypothetical protein